MRTKATLIIILFVSVRCGEYTKHGLVKEYKTDNIANTENTIRVPAVNINTTTIRINQLNQLAPIDIVNSKSTNVYQKYGLEFMGNCYACDLAELSVTEKRIKLTNVCDENRNQVFEILEINNTNNVIKIKTKKYDFILTEIDKAPIYKLKINGNFVDSKNLRISKYYTLEKILKKFDENDCGDFQG